jgi:hypothetical protein
MALLPLRPVSVCCYERTGPEMSIAKVKANRVGSAANKQPHRVHRTMTSRAHPHALEQPKTYSHPFVRDFMVPPGGAMAFG